MLFRSNDTATTEIYTHSDTLPLHDALPISRRIESLLTDRTALIAAAASTARFGRRDAAQRLARLVLDLDPGAARPTDLAEHAA